LWEEAELNRWAPRVTGRRSWGSIRAKLLDAAVGKAAKGSSLIEHMLVPEPFAAENKGEIAARRRARLSRIAGDRMGIRKLMLLIGEVKEIGPARFGDKLVIRHLPDFPFMLGTGLRRRIETRFDAEFTLWNGIAGSHLVAIATFGMGPAGLATIEEIALMVTTETWIPIETVYDAALIDALVGSGHRFVKSLRYTLPRKTPLACAILPETKPAPTALYVAPPGADSAYRAAVGELTALSRLDAWLWLAGDGGMPPLPSPAAAS
jgi:hypothetical protein